MNGQKIDFSGGKGYIEKDWGTSFPESWIWVHCNHFNSEDVSFLLSVAKIPWMGKYFIGLLGFLQTSDHFYRFATYNRSRIVRLEQYGNKLKIGILNKDFTLDVDISIKQFSDLKAPRLGIMDRHMKESMDSDVEIMMKDRKGNIIQKVDGQRAGLEINGNIETLKEVIK